MSSSSLLKFVWQYFSSHNDDMIVVRKSLIDICDGDFNAAMLISHILYWHNKYHDMDRWMKITYEEWYEQCRMTERKLINAKKNAQALGFIEVKVKRFNKTPCLHFRINFENLTKALENYIENDLRNRQNVEINEIDKTSKSEIDETSVSLTEYTKHSITTKNIASSEAIYCSKIKNQDIIDVYHEELPQNPKVEVIGDTLKTQLNNMQKNWKSKYSPNNLPFSLEAFRQYLRYLKINHSWFINERTFPSGKIGRNGIRTITKPKNLEKFRNNEFD